MAARKIAILVLGCASGPYVELIDTIRRTWGQKRVTGVDIYYLFGLPADGPAQTALEQLLGESIPPVADGGIRDLDKLLIAGCPDSISVQEDCILHKRLIAFEYLASRHRYDFIYTVCAASYIDQYELVRHVDRLDGQDLISGAIGVDATGKAPFVSGASMLLSANVAERLAKCRANIVRENSFGFRDDVAIGHWIAEHMSRAPMQEIIDALHNRCPLPPESVFSIASDTTMDFVRARPDAMRLRRGVFHYHFHSAGAQDMADFHERYFLHQTRSLWGEFSDA